MLCRRTELKLNTFAGIPSQEGLGKTELPSYLLNTPIVEYAGCASAHAQFLSTDEVIRLILSVG